MNLLDRFLKYVSIPTNSDSMSKTTPSTSKQLIFGEILYNDLNEIGLNVYFDRQYGYIYAKLEGNKDCTPVGFVSHMDTSENASDENIKPIVINNYNGEDVYYDNGNIMEISKYPDLLNHKNETLITSDGNTLLGADDKAGIVEIIAMIEKIKKDNVEHGDIYVCFTPDEEIGCGTDHFNYSMFPVKYAYTIDGSAVCEINYENFNAAKVDIEINGISTHPGYAKNLMINAIEIGIELDSMLSNEKATNTENYEGFYHLKIFDGKVDKTKLKYIIRDFYQDGLSERKAKLTEIVNLLNKKYNNCILLDIKDQYSNMLEIIRNDLIVVEIVEQAMRESKIEPIIVPARGGTDGAQLTFNGILCPNIGTGGHNFHSVYEYVALEDMEKTTDILVKIVEKYSLINNKILVKK